jgi:hypothetical protein
MNALLNMTFFKEVVRWLSETSSAELHTELQTNFAFVYVLKQCKIGKHNMY